MINSNIRNASCGTAHRHAITIGVALIFGGASLIANAGASNGTYTKTTKYSIIGTVLGLTSPGLVLRNGSTSRLIHAGATTFDFGSFPAGTAYSLVVATQPQAQVCVVANGAGTLPASTDIQVNCSEKPRWSWMSGASTVYANGVYGTKGVSAADNTPGARYESTRWTDSSGNFWLFGGIGLDASGASDYLNDLWEYNPVTHQWTWIGGSNVAGGIGIYGTLGIAGANNIPGGRVGSNQWTDANGDVWIFGGLGKDGTGNGYFLNDFWKYRPTTNQWTAINNAQYTGAGTVDVCGVQGVANALNIPGPRTLSVSWTDGDGDFWLFGGYGCDVNNTLGVLNDMWEYNTASGVWTRIGGSQNVGANGSYGIMGSASTNSFPGARQRSVGWVDSYGNFWLFGGDGIDASGTSGLLNDLWEFDVATKSWTWINGSSSVYSAGIYGQKGSPSPINVPGARSGAVSWFDISGDFWMFGGYGMDSTGVGTYVLSDLWKFDTSTYTWTWMSGSDLYLMNGVYGTLGVAAADNIPGARYQSVSWVDGDRNLWLFGGFGVDSTGTRGFLNDMWKYKSN